jgi:para-nitrobenzyl esterase
VSTVPIERGITRTERTIEKLLVADGRSENREVAKEIRENMSLDEIEDYLRGKNTGEIIEARLTAKGGMGIHNAYEDGVVIPGSLISTIKTGQYNKVPIILGSNESEAKSFLVILGDNMKTSSGHTWSDLRQVLYDEDPPTLDEIMPLPSDREFYEACAFHLSQFWKALFVDSIARELKDKQDNVFGYYFKWGGKGSGPEPADFILGACHALEISLFFGTEGRGRFSLFFTEENRVGREKLQEAMMAYVAQFARTGNPNRSGLGLLPWPEWSHGDGEPKCIIFDATFTEANLGILNEEVSVAKVMSTVNELAPDIRAAVMALARQMR